MSGVIAVSEPTAKQVAAKKLMRAAFLESVCVIAGLIAYGLTGSWMWLLIGVIGGFGFTLPAIIVYVGARMEERKRASR